MLVCGKKNNKKIKMINYCTSYKSAIKGGSRRR